RRTDHPFPTRRSSDLTFTPGNGDTNALDPNLKIPTVWKASLTGGYNFGLGPLGDGWRAQIDLLYADFRDSLIWKDLRSVQIGTADRKSTRLNSRREKL